MVNGERIERSVVVLPERILHRLAADVLRRARCPSISRRSTDLGREIVLLGTGSAAAVSRARRSSIR